MLRDFNSDFTLHGLMNYDVDFSYEMGKDIILKQASNPSTNKKIGFSIEVIRQIEVENKCKNLEIIKQLNLPGLVHVIDYYFFTKVPNFLKQKFNIEQENVFIVIFDGFKHLFLEYPLNEYTDSKGIKNRIINPTTKSKIIYCASKTIQILHKNKLYKDDIKYNLYRFALDENNEPKMYSFIFSVFQTDERRQMIMFDSSAICILFYEMYYGSDRFLSKMGNVFGDKLEKCENFPDYFCDFFFKCKHKIYSKEFNRKRKCAFFDDLNELLSDDKIVFDEFGMKTDLNEFHKYKRKFDMQNALSLHHNYTIRNAFLECC